MHFDPVHIPLSGERFVATYTLCGEEKQARATANSICVEQTVEFPEDLLPEGDIALHILGRIEEFSPAGPDRWTARISFASEVAGKELTQLFNVVFGNISLMEGIRLERLQLSPDLLRLYGGPRFGRLGFRQLLQEPERPLLSTALKPMGLSADSLARLAHAFALGGIDLIKDDHGLADQSFAPWRERVKRCAAAVGDANAQTGGHSVYLPNITSSCDRVVERAYEAKRAGAGGVLIAPGLTGFSVVRELAADSSFGLPIMSHPSYLGGFLTHPDNGVSHFALLGQFMRLAGADATVFPNYGGRFSFSREACRDIVNGTVADMDHIASIFPAPGGGMTLERVDEMRVMYGPDVIFLIGGGLFRGGSDVTDTSRRLREAVSNPFPAQ